MRIVAGKWRSRQIEWPGGGQTRPVTDRVRQAIFDVLGSRYGTPGSLPALCVADVFAGGGSFGLEALSRGASRVCFFENDREALAVLHRNLAALSAEDQTAVVRRDVWHCTLQPPASVPPWDLVFIDPPYQDSMAVSPSSQMGDMLRRLHEAAVCAAGVLLVCRHESKVDWPDELGAGWIVEERRRYGRSSVVLVVQADPQQPTATGRTTGEPEP